MWRRIRLLQDMARTLMLHAKMRWSDAITANLWPYALRYANQILNETPTKHKNQQVPTNIIGNSNASPLLPSDAVVNSSDAAVIANLQQIELS